MMCFARCGPCYRRRFRRIIDTVITAPTIPRSGLRAKHVNANTNQLSEHCGRFSTLYSAICHWKNVGWISYGRC